MSLLKIFKSKKSNKNDGFDYHKLTVLAPSQTSLISTDHDCKSPDSPSADTPIDSFGFGAFDDKPPSSLLETDTTLLENGYQQLTLIRNIPEGQIIEACSTQDQMKMFVIKKIEKTLYGDNVAIEKRDGVHIRVQKAFIKEALLLHHCTVSNKPPSPLLSKFVEFFQNGKYYYLVMEKAGDINLAVWVERAFKYIQNGQLKLSHYKRIIKYMFWQISMLMYWLHNDMSLCLLDIKMEDIMVSNGDFTLHQDGVVTINPKIMIKLSDFGQAEIFKTMPEYFKKQTNAEFDCNKHDFGDTLCHHAPNVFHRETYNAKKSDVWSLGILLYRLAFGQYPFKEQSFKTDRGFLAIRTDDLYSYVLSKKLSKYTTASMLGLISGMLHYGESSRFGALEILQSEYLNVYWQKYKVSITKKSFTQQERLSSDFQQKRMLNFPFYRK